MNVTHPHSPQHGMVEDSLRGPWWRVATDDLVVESLGENEFALFNPSFADSTLINAVDACLLSFLNDHREGLREQDLLKLAARALELSADGRLPQYVAESLSQMELMGIVIRSDDV